MKRTAVGAISTALVALLCGCRSHAPPPPKGYFGPTEPMSAVVQQINANNNAIPTLRVAGDFEAQVVDQGKNHFVNGDITLLYRAPDAIRLIAKKDIAGPVFEAGSDGDRYWLIVKADTDTMWCGRIKNLDRVDRKQLPIRPDALIEVLGVDPIPTDFLGPLAPTMRFNNDADAYMINFNVRLPDRWAVRKEVWFDRQTKLARLVLLFDENGRIVVRAYLSNQRAIETEAAPDARPRLATRYQVYFPDTGTTMRFDLDDLALTRGRAPNDQTFTFPANPGVSRVINLDEQARL